MCSSDLPHRWVAVEKSKAGEAASPKKDALGPIAGWAQAAKGWDEEAATHSFVLSTELAKSSDLHWLRYRHIVPTKEDWDAISDQPKNPNVFFAPDPAGPRPQLISDFCGYNAYSGGNGEPANDRYWIGDLTLSGSLDVDRKSTRLNSSH